MGNSKKIITISVVFLLLFLIAPSTTSKIITSEKIDKDNGSITGQVCSYSTSWGPRYPLSLVKVEIQDKYDFTNLRGEFEIKDLQVDKSYEIRFSIRDQELTTKNVYLSSDEPIKDIYVEFHVDDIPKAKTTTAIGTIYGNTGTSLIWGFTPVPFATVTAGFSSTVSLYPMGSYRITGLPLNKEITVTASKRGYTEFTETVILTEKHPTKQVFLNMERDGEDIKSKNIEKERKIDLFSFISLCSNTRSNFFSATSFMH